MGYMISNENLTTNRPKSFSELQWILPESHQEDTEEHLAAVKQLAGGIAHHFNNALQIITGSAELASRRSDLPEAVKQDLARILKEGEDVAKLTRQLLDFSCQPVARKESVFLVSVIEDAVQQLASTLPEDIQISLDVEPGCRAIIVWANSTQIKQMLTSLASNARDAMPMGGKLQFRLYIPRSVSGGIPVQNRIVLSVSDNGTGISGQDLPHVFEPFFTTREVGQGAGLGLSQVYGIMKQHDGDIEVESQPEQGTTFSLYFPILSAPQMIFSRNSGKLSRDGSSQLRQLAI